jgi:hypothetical protein
VTGVMLPELDWRPTVACSPRYGHAVNVVVAHRWGVRFVNLPEEARSYQGVIGEFLNPRNEASAHFVFPGSAVPNACTQLVRYSDLAWTQAAYNSAAVEVEAADAVWLGDDPEGMAQLARIFGFLLHHFKLPPVWSTRHGLCRHGDLGQAGGGHLACPTTDLHLWRHFVALVQRQYELGGYRPLWGR